MKILPQTTIVFYLVLFKQHIALHSLLFLLCFKWSLTQIIEVAMLACIGYIVPEFVRFPGGPVSPLIRQDINHGL